MEGVEPSALTQRGGVKRDEEEGGIVFQSSSSWEQQVRLQWRLRKWDRQCLHKRKSICTKISDHFSLRQLH